MRLERVVAVARERRVLVAGAALVALLAAGSVVALVSDDGTSTAPLQATGRPGVASVNKQVPAADAPPVAESRDAAAPVRSGAALSAAGTAGGGAAPSPVPASAPSLAAADKAGAKVVKTATLRVQVGKGHFAGAFDRAAAIAAGHGGYVASSSEATVDDKASEGTITIRVPADQFENARRDLGGLGKIQHQELSGQDVTAQLVDYDARIRSLQGQEQALSTLLSRARSVGEVLEVQGQLFNVRQQIEQLQAERANIDAQAEMSTINLTVFEPGAALSRTEPKPEPATGLARSWSRAWDGMIAVIGGTVIVVGYLLPLTALALLGWTAWRLATRRRRLPAAPAAS